MPPASPGALVFFALHEVPLVMGPTELTAGSHLFSEKELRRSECTTTLFSAYSLTVDAYTIYACHYACNYLTPWYAYLIIFSLAHCVDCLLLQSASNHWSIGWSWDKGISW